MGMSADYEQAVRSCSPACPSPCHVAACLGDMKTWGSHDLRYDLEACL